MATHSQKSRLYPIRRPRKSMRPDRVHPRDFRLFLEPEGAGFFCESCAYFRPEGKLCALGYKTQHQFDLQKELFDRTGTMTFCRALEID